MGEVLCRIIGKAVLDAIRPDVLEVTGKLQLCTGQMAGSEAAVHTINALFSDESSDADLLIDVSNAFNCLNRQVAFQNLMAICTSLATIASLTHTGITCHCLLTENIFFPKKALHKETHLQW